MPPTTAMPRLPLLLLAIWAVVANAQDGKKVDDKLPFSTGMIISIQSPWLKRTCEVHSAHPWPWAADAMDGAMEDVDGAMVDVDVEKRRKRKVIEWPGNTVFCNVSADDGGDSKDDCMGFWDCSFKGAAKAFRSIMPTHASPSPKVRGWDMGGFNIMSTDFQSPDIREGEPVLLKSQNAHKFCRVSEDDYFAVICDQMTSGGQEGGGVGDGKDEQFELERAPKDLGTAAMAANQRTLGRSSLTWGPPGPDDGKPVALFVRSALTGRYCSPNKHLSKPAPITCNTKKPDERDVWMFQPTSYYPPYSV